MTFSQYVVVSILSLITLRKIKTVERIRIKLKEKVEEANDSNRV